MWRSNVGLADASGHAVGGAQIKLKEAAVADAGNYE
jgi:hypothetical protein